MSRSITLDLKRCPGPFECGLCLEVCQEGVIMARPVRSGSGEKEWRIVPVLLHHCDRCGLCVEACPEGEISL